MKIALLGDTAFYGKFCLSSAKPLEYLKSVSEQLKKYDYVVLNLETPFVEGNISPYGNKSAYLKSDPLNIELLKFLNINAVNLANNHVFDYGKKTFEFTLELLKRNNIEYFGVKNNNIRVTQGENKIAFDGYCCYSTNPLGMGKDGVNILNYQDVLKSLKNNNNYGYNNIISIHAGQEHVNYPHPDHIKLARKLSSHQIGYVYYGHHPHVLQGIEKYNDSLHAYSLGNFCFDDVYTKKSKEPLIKISENNKRSIILELEYKDNKLMNYDILPLYDAVPVDIDLSNRIKESIKSYSLELEKVQDEYINTRDNLISEYIQGRKQKRDFNWYIKRMNYNSVKIILNARENQKKYLKNVKRYID